MQVQQYWTERMADFRNSIASFGKEKVQMHTQVGPHACFRRRRQLTTKSVLSQLLQTWQAVYKVASDVE